MAADEVSKTKSIVTGLFRGLARLYITIHRPRIVVVSGSVGKTSTKLMLAKFLSTEMKVSFMDDSYNSGLGLYLSVFEKKVPNRQGVFSWLIVLAKVVGHFFKHYEILLLEYGIDRPGEMDELIAFAKPHSAILTAVTPEHMEFLQTIDIVGDEETKILQACKGFGVVNSVDVDHKYLKDITVELFEYGSKDDIASYTVNSRTANGSIVTFLIDNKQYKSQETMIISDALIRQICGALLMSQKLGISKTSLENAISTIEPAASRMYPLKGINGSNLIDDTANFSPIAGVVAIRTLKDIKAKRRIAILGNMHELGEYIDEGYKQVGEEFDKLDILALVGDMSIKFFGAIALASGFKLNDTLFYFDTSTEAGIYVRDNVAKQGDVILVKGPFGGYYLEEATKKLLANPKDSVRLTRQSIFWQNKKRDHFGPSLDA